jgi:3-dehydroquinate dehydratase
MAQKHALTAPFIHLCNGPFSRMHRFIGPVLGGSIAFAVDRYEPRYGMTQPTLRAMKAVLDNLHWNITDVT